MDALCIRHRMHLFPGILMLTRNFNVFIPDVDDLKKQAKPNILTAFVGSALVCLFLTIFLGITLIYSLQTGFAAEYYQAYL